MVVTNTDDHLRNRAFILTDKGWILSPLYDVNPVPYGDELSLNVDEEDNRISIDLAVQTLSLIHILCKVKGNESEMVHCLSWRYGLF